MTSADRALPGTPGRALRHDVPGAAMRLLGWLRRHSEGWLEGYAALAGVPADLIAFPGGPAPGRPGRGRSGSTPSTAPLSAAELALWRDILGRDPEPQSMHTHIAQQGEQP